MSYLDNKIKSFKLHILQQRYRQLTDQILKLEKHIDNLYINNYIDFAQKNQILGNIFIVSKNLNLSYNNYIIEKLDNKITLDIKLFELLTLFGNDINENFLIEKIIPILKQTPNCLPLYEYENEINNIISEVGYDNLLDLINIYNNKFDLTNE